MIDGATRWSTELGLGESPRPVGVLAAGGGVLVVGTSDDDRDVLTALDQETGALLWQRDFEPRLVTRPRAFVVDGVVLVDTEDDGPRILALEAATGELRWEQRVGLLSAWTVVDGVVVSHDDDAVTARDATSGAERFVVPLTSTGTISVSRDLVVVAAPDVDGDSTTLTGLSPDGSERWQGRVDGLLRLSDLQPRADAAVIIGSTFDELVGLDARSGEELWRVPSLDVAAPLVIDHAAGRALLCAADDDALRLRSVVLADGTDAWSLDVAASSPGRPTLIGLTDDVALVSASSQFGLCRPGIVQEGSVEAYSLVDGRRVWETSVSESERETVIALLRWDHAHARTPGLVIGALLVDAIDGSDRLLDPDTGEVLHVGAADRTTRTVLLGESLVSLRFEEASTTLTVLDGASVELPADIATLGVLDGVAYLLGMDGTLVAVD